MRLYTYRIPNVGDVVTSPGTRTETLFTPKFNGSEIILVKSGTVDVQERIESYAPYCDIRYMLTQLRLGDSSVLSPKQPLFGDFSGMPSHPVDAINFITDVQSLCQLCLRHAFCFTKLADYISNLLCIHNFLHI